MKKLLIEWQHIEEKGGTCQRCFGTGKNLQNAIKAESKRQGKNGVELVYKETILPVDKITLSNSIIFNGVLLEDILSDAKAGESCCESCCSLIGKKTNCRTIKYRGQAYEEIPEKIIRQAIEASAEGLQGF